MAASRANVELMLQIIREVRSHGIQVRVIKGWRNRGRPYSFRPRGFLEHHDASSTSSGNSGALGIIITGRSGIPGPLAQLQVERNGTLVVVAAGLANHAGYGGPWHGIPRNQGNTYLLGMEVANNGINEPYPSEVTRTIIATERAALNAMDAPIHMLGGHREWAPDRKIDPRISMDQRRQAVRNFTGQLEDDMEPQEVWHGKDVDLIPVSQVQFNAEFRKGNPTFTPKHALYQAWNQAAAAHVAAREARNRTRRIEKALSALADNLQPQVRDAVRRELSAADVVSVSDLENVGVDTTDLAKELAPLLLDGQVTLTEENLRLALSEAFRRAAGGLEDQQEGEV